MREKIELILVWWDGTRDNIALRLCCCCCCSLFFTTKFFVAVLVVLVFGHLLWTSSKLAAKRGRSVERSACWSDVSSLT